MASLLATHLTHFTEIRNTYPIQLSIVCKNHIWRAERKVCAQAGSLDSVEIVEKGNGVGSGVEYCREQTAIAASGIAASIVVTARRRDFGIVYLFDYVA